MFSHKAKTIGNDDFQAKILINVGQLYKKDLRALLQILPRCNEVKWQRY